MQQYLRFATQTWVGRLVTVSVLALLLVGAFYVVARPATSLRIYVYINESRFVSPHPQPNRVLFDKTITDIGLVHAVQEAMDTATSSGGDCVPGNPVLPIWMYRFTFSTLGDPPVEEYDGAEYCQVWTKYVQGVPFHGMFNGLPTSQVDAWHVQLDGQEFMVVLHNRIGVPICSFPGLPLGA